MLISLSTRIIGFQFFKIYCDRMFDDDFHVLFICSLRRSKNRQHKNYYNYNPYVLFHQINVVEHNHYLNQTKLIDTQILVGGTTQRV